MPPELKSTATACVTAHLGDDPGYGAVIPPLYLTSTYNFPALDQMGPYDYGRGGNPNRNALAQTIAALENGAGGVVTSSGMAAIDLVLNLIKADDLVIAPHDAYGGTHRLLNSRQEQGRLRVQFIDQNNPTAINKALAAKPALFLIESPSNPLMRLVDIKALGMAAKAAGALVVCDNTFLSPARQQPLSLGADLVVHSTTKFLNGHSDVVGGIAIAKHEALAEKLNWWANCTGVTGAPFDSYLTLRGLRTLQARMDIQELNAIKVATFLDAHHQVSKVYYPGLPGDPGYLLARQQQSGPGALLSFELNANHEALGRFVQASPLFQLAESLGGTESLICHPASMTHRAMSEEARQTAGISESLLRISVGLEASADQLQALRTMFAAL